MGVCLWNLELYIIWGYAYGRFWLLYKNNAQKCTEKWAYLKNGLSYSLVAWRGCYYQQSPAIATFTYAKGWKKKKIQTCENFQEYSRVSMSNYY